MKRFLLSSFLLFVLVAGAGIFAPTDSSFVGFSANKLCADEVLQRGIKCEVQYSDCAAHGPNWANLAQAVVDGSLTVTDIQSGTTSSAGSSFINVMEGAGLGTQRAFGGQGELGKYCYDKSRLKDIVELRMPRDAVAFGAYGPVERMSNAFGYTIKDMSIFRGCAPNTTYTRNSNAITGTYAGCCPKDYRIALRFARVGDTTGALTYSGGACCLAVGGLDPKEYFDGKCRDNNSNPVASGLDTFLYNGVPMDIALPVNGNLNATQDLGREFGISTGLFKEALAPRAPYACPSGTVCAIDAGGSLNDVKKASDYSVPNTSANLQCGKCFMDGQLIGTSDPGVAGQKGFARFCDSKAPNGLYRDDELIGGSGDITQGAGLEDPDNQILYKACFDSGGIYTAIGCVDPTPTGIITGLIRIALGVMGGIALMQMVYVGILYQMGDTEKIKKARSQLFATLSGLFVLVFSILILRIIGINILDVIPQGSV